MNATSFEIWISGLNTARLIAKDEMKLNGGNKMLRFPEK